ncbi:hypothetical protein DFJ74DRAFT_763208 [Hyaloraphidium curvatum]|nr:hypothetical protein DFJ74DRAFT_763208 [Hyaloraphidium curvatum]
MNSTDGSGHGGHMSSDVPQFAKDREWQLRVEGPLPLWHRSVLAHGTIMTLAFVLLPPLVVVAGRRKWPLHPLLGMLSAVGGPVLGLLALWLLKGDFRVVSQSAWLHKLLGWVMVLLSFGQAAVGAVRNLRRWRATGSAWDLPGRLAKWNPILRLPKPWRSGGDPAARGEVLLARAHAVLAPVLVLSAPWQVLLGIIAAARFGYWWHPGSAVSHFVKGILLIKLAAFWILRSLGLLRTQSGPLSLSNETLESLGLILLGCITMFTEEIELDPRSHRNQEHWIVGAVLFVGGFAGLAVQHVISRRLPPPEPGAAPHRNLLPAISFAVVGYVLSQHTAQFTSLSAVLHTSFGALLFLAACARALALAPALAHLDHLASFLVLCAGLVLMSAYDEWVDVLLVLSIDGAAYLAAVAGFAAAIVGWVWFWGGMWLGPRDDTGGTAAAADEEGYRMLDVPNGDGEAMPARGIFGGRSGSFDMDVLDLDPLDVGEEGGAAGRERANGTALP